VVRGTNSSAAALQNAQNPVQTHRQNTLLLLLIFATVIGAGVFWLRQQDAEQSPRGRLPEELREEPDLLVNDAVVHQFRPSGERKYLLRARVIKHFSKQALTRMEAPDLLLERSAEAAQSPQTPEAKTASSDRTADEAPWRATADFGYARISERADGGTEEVVFLRENVELSQTREPPRYLSMRGEALYLYPDREFVETDESVTIDTHTGRTKAQAMSGDLKTGVLRLTGDTKQVQTIVLPFQFK